MRIYLDYFEDMTNMSLHPTDYTQSRISLTSMLLKTHNLILFSTMTEVIRNAFVNIGMREYVEDFMEIARTTTSN